MVGIAKSAASRSGLQSSTGVEWEGNLAQLKRLASLEEQTEEQSIREWLGRTFGDDGRHNHTAYETLIPAKNIEYTKILGHAEQWDADGLTTIPEWLEALECEVAGTEKREAVESLLGIEWSADGFSRGPSEEEFDRVSIRDSARSIYRPVSEFFIGVDGGGYVGE